MWRYVPWVPSSGGSWLGPLPFLLLSPDPSNRIHVITGYPVDHENKGPTHPEDGVAENQEQPGSWTTGESSPQLCSLHQAFLSGVGAHPGLLHCTSQGRRSHGGGGQWKALGLWSGLPGRPQRPCACLVQALVWSFSYFLVKVISIK